MPVPFGQQQWCKQDQIPKTNTKTKVTRPRPKWQDQDQDRCLQDQDQNDKTKTTGSKQRHFAYLTFQYVNATVDLHGSDVPSTE